MPTPLLFGTKAQEHSDEVPHLYTHLQTFQLFTLVIKIMRNTTQ